MSSGSRGRSLVRKVTGKRYRSGSRSRSGSTARYSSLSDRQDGITKRGFARAQGYSMYFDPFPRTMRAILRYTTTVNLNAAVANPSKHYFRAGSIWDPDFTGTGEQPYGHDQYQPLFNHYRVVKSVCKISNTTAGANNIMGLMLSDDTSVGNNYDLMRLIKPVKSIPLCTTTISHSLAMTYDSEKAFPGQSQNTTALFGNDPAEEQYFVVFVEGSNALADPSAISILVNIEYYVEFSELKSLGMS